MIFNVIIYIIKMQIKRDYFQPDNWLLLLGLGTLPRINVRHGALRQSDAQIKPVLICVLHDIRQRATTQQYPHPFSIFYNLHLIQLFMFVGSRPSDHYFRSVCLFVCLLVRSFSQPSLIRFQSN